ncbi:hypothetical protein [Rhizobium hidalgonense]|uniref:hypothetical protein n=1 Tax=Rhizobium hidalgonense TaxID=1538159 RepID=UPI0011060CFA|nr:hypothetical protein [Rhizobium hidalgonense]QKK23525.1 hypothetical protein FFM81_009270 [Rhizobium hidalgonense]
MMRRTMVLTQRQARFENHSKAAFCNANSDISIEASALVRRRPDRMGIRGFSFVRTGNGWLHRLMFEISVASTTEEKRT